MSGDVLKKLIPFKYKRAIKENLGVPSLHWSLQNIRRKGFNPSVVIDVGAYEGLWALDFLEVFPQAKVLMVEAQRKKEEYLQKIVKRRPNISYAIRLLSSTNGETKRFFENETASHVTTSSLQVDNTVELKTITLDVLLAQERFPLPDFLKLDVQGHEKEVLLGAEKCLAHTTFCLLELSLLNIGDDTPLFAEMISFMDTKGFQAYDISHFIRRPYDKALYQVDMIFVKKDSLFVNEKRW